MYSACLMVAWVCSGWWVSFVACQLFDQDELFCRHGMRETLGVDPSEGAFTREEVRVFRVAFP